MSLDRGDVAFTIYLLANIVWAIAAFQDLGGIYVIADVVCAIAAGLLLLGWRLGRPAILLAGVALTLVGQGPFYVRGFGRGGIGMIAQTLFVLSCVAMLVALWAWHRREPERARSAFRLAGWLVMLDGAAFLLAEGELWTLWQAGNLLSGIAGVPLMIVNAPRARA